MSADFCDFSGMIANGDEAVKALPKRYRCPQCGRRLLPTIGTCTGDSKNYCCIYAHIPRHKKPAGGKKFVRKDK